MSIQSLWCDKSYIKPKHSSIDQIFRYSNHARFCWTGVHAWNAKVKTELNWTFIFYDFRTWNGDSFTGYGLGYGVIISGVGADGEKLSLTCLSTVRNAVSCRKSTLPFFVADRVFTRTCNNILQCQFCTLLWKFIQCMLSISVTTAPFKLVI